MKVLFCFVVLFVGCTTSQTVSSPQRSSESEVLDQSEVDFMVDHMESQGADRAEASAFVNELNKLQREWEENQK